jgi:hypothetical protein
VAKPARHDPEIALILLRAGAIRIGVRAFSTLEGYAGRNRETELASPVKFRGTPDHRPGSRLRLERRQTRSSNDRASVRLYGLFAVQSQNGPKGLRAAWNWAVRFLA